MMYETLTARSAMNPTRLLDLRCPACRACLVEEPQALLCTRCEIRFPVTDGVTRMLGASPQVEQQTRAAFDFEHRRFQTARYLRISDTRIDDWLADVQLPHDYFNGITALDLGCGSGRWTYAMAKLGARVVAVDFSDAAVEITRDITRNLPAVRVFQADLFRLPFEPAQFDFVVSWGVLHHTAETRAAFRAIAPLVRPGGILHIMIYERRSPLKVLGTGLLRGILRRLPAETRYRICGRLVIKNRRVYQLLRGLIACIPVEDLSACLDQETAQFGLYDWYSPTYNHLHRVAEVRQWFEEAGFGDLQLTNPIKYTRSLDVLRFGQCGGSIHLRGTKRVGEPQRT
jgi:SAM-dependent methyltransferase